MKTKHILFALMGLVGSACSNQDLEERYTDAGQVQVTAGIAKSRVSFNEADDMVYAYWQNGDAITLSTPTQGNLNYTATVSEEDARMATFAPEGGSLKDIVGETVYACYPASTITDGVVALPATDKWTDEKPLPFAYAVSSITDSKVNLSFDHTFAFLKLTLTAKALESATSSDGEKTVHRLLLKSASEPLGVVSGTFSFEDKNATVAEGSNEVVFTLSEAFNPADETERSVYIPILPQPGDVAMTISLVHEYEGGEDVLLEVEKQTPTDGLVKGNVYVLELGGSSSAVIEGDAAEIHLAEAGTLSDYITDENKYTIKSLILSGYLNGDDIRLLREMSTGSGVLTDLDTEEATIVEGGGPYHGSWDYTENNIWGEYFFEETKLVTVVLPKSVVSIGGAAFRNCGALETVTIPDGTVLASIEGQAFADCSSLKSFVIPDGVTTMGDNVFIRCKSLSSVTIGKNLTSIEISAFAGCEALMTVTIPEDAALTSIGEYAFSNCAIRTITLPENLKTIGGGAFRDCSLTQIKIPDSVTTIGGQAFSDCRSLARVTMGAGVTSIGGSAFYNCSTLISINLSEGVIAIEDYTFKGCSALKSIVIPDAVTWIGPLAFEGCYALTSATIGQGVTSIGYEAFANCQALKSIAIPDATTYIGNNAFYSCSSLETVTLGNSVSFIGERAFQSCSSLKEIAIPESITYMGYYVFLYCESLVSATNVIPEYGAFIGCTSLTNVTISNKTKEIGHDAFGGDYGNFVPLKEIVIPEGVKIIRSAAFSDCRLLEKVNIPESVIEIEGGAFSGCSSLLSVTLPPNLSLVNSSTFYGCSSFTEIVIPNNVTAIGESAFSGCTAMEKVTLGEIVTVLEGNAFANVPMTECISYAVEPPLLKNGPLSSIDKETAKLYVPKGSLAAYQESDWATYFGNIIEMEE